MFLFDAVLVDMGSCYMGKDEETEGIHWLYWLMVGRHRSDRSWVDGITYASLMLPHLDGKDFGAASGAKKSPTGRDEKGELVIRGWKEAPIQQKCISAEKCSLASRAQL